MKNILKILIIIVVTTTIVGCSNPDNYQDNTEYTTYVDSDNYYSIDVPAGWDIKDDEESNSQYWSKVDMAPPDYSSEIYPYLITVSISNFNFDMNINYFDLTNTIVDREDIDWNGRKATHLKLRDDNTNKINHAYILEYIGGQSIVFYLRSDEPEYVAILKHIWDSFDSKR